VSFVNGDEQPLSSSNSRTFIVISLKPQGARVSTSLLISERASVPSAQNDGHPMKLASFFYIFLWTPFTHWKALSESLQRTQFRAKNTKNDLNPTDLVKRNFCFETEGVYV
jgi:hypothetical protein